MLQMGGWHSGVVAGPRLAAVGGMSFAHAHAQASAYRRRTPEKEPLYQILAEHLETFLERTRSSDRQLPAHVEMELRAYLECGILANGFLRVRCEDCAHERVVYGWYRRRAKEQGHGDGRCGSVSFVQRFGSALNLNPHYHVLMPDGVYVTDADGTPSFVRAPQLTDDEVQWIVETTASNVDPLWEDEPLLATITAASVQGQIATGERAGLRVRRRPRDREAVSRSRRRDSLRPAVLCLAWVLTACRHPC